jgi:hypothetical protein
VRRGKTRQETAYYRLRAALIPERVNEVARQRCSVKNSLYFRLDGVMNEDRQGKTRMGHPVARSRHAAPHAPQRHAVKPIQRAVARKGQPRRRGETISIISRSYFEICLPCVGTKGVFTSECEKFINLMH